MDATQRQQNPITQSNNNAFHDQSRVPAAMRTSINFGVSEINEFES